MMTATERRERREARKASDARIAAAQEKAREIVQTGKCPDCGSPLRRNLALTGWWQCVAYGEPYMREAAYRDLPHCSFQCFTR